MTTRASPTCFGRWPSRKPPRRLERGAGVDEEAADAARAFGHLSALHRVLSEYGTFEGYLGHLERCRELEQEALDLTVEVGDFEAAAGCRQNLACTLRMLGRTQEAAEMMREAAASLLALSSAGELAALGDDFGAILAETGQIALPSGSWPRRTPSMRSSGRRAARSRRTRSPRPTTRHGHG